MDIKILLMQGGIEVGYFPVDSDLDQSKLLLIKMTLPMLISILLPNPMAHTDTGDLPKKVDDIDNYDKNAYELRNTPGQAIGGDNLPIIEDNLFKGTYNSVGKLLKQIVDKMNGMEFRNFDQFRQTFWKLVADDPKLSSNFNPEFLNGIRKGVAPAAQMEQWNGKIEQKILKKENKDEL